MKCEINSTRMSRAMALKMKDIVDVRRENGIVVAELLECGCWVDVKASGTKRGAARRRCPTHRFEKSLSIKEIIAKARGNA
jgi:hypothetical protein